MIYIIEHLDGKVGEWSFIEYEHISELVGQENLWITNVKEKWGNALKLQKIAKVFEKSVAELDLDLGKVGVLDPEGSKRLEPGDCNKIEYFVFGGILGDNPPRKRTGRELTLRLKGTKVFNLGKEQMPTDNAVYVVKETVEGKRMNDLKFTDKVEIKINDILTTELDYRYVVVKGKPLISKELVEYIKKKDSEM